MNKIKNIAVLVDGYNLYHGIEDICRDHPQDDLHYLKWISLQKLVKQFVPPNTNSSIKIYYFTAYADWQGEARERHRLFVRALRNEEVEIILGKFKKKNRKCPKCGKRYNDYEEKETDVNITVHMLRLAYEHIYDDLFVITGDTDIVPAILEAKKMHPEGNIKIIAPPNRENSELKQCADSFSRIQRLHLEASLLQKIIKPPKGVAITRPEKYNPPNKLPNGD